MRRTDMRGTARDALSAPPRAVRAPFRAAAPAAGTLSLTIIFVAALVLQRFAVPFGESAKVNLVTFVAFAVVAMGLSRGQLVLDVRRAAAWCAFAGWCVVSAVYTMQIKKHAGLRTSLPSLLHFVGLYLPFVFRFSGTMARREVYARFQQVAVFVAIAGIAQFLAQLVGISIFTFLDFMPEELSVEPQYNVVIPIGATGLMKSNGLFLVEPSVFSQVMAIAIGLELIYFRRVPILCVLFTGLLFSVSGTGLMVLALVMVLVATTTRALDLRLILGLLAASAMFALLGFFAFEDLGALLVHRTDEFSSERTSGYARFVTPLLAVAEVSVRYPDAAIWGLGPGSSEKLDLGFGYGVWTPTKVMFEYGGPGLALWLTLLVVSLWRRGEAAILLPLFFLFFFTGGYHQFGPWIYVLAGLFALAPRPGVASPAQGRTE